MTTINQYLQHKGIDPNKEASNVTFTAYNIDSFGERTILPSLFVHNTNNYWTDKAKSTSGKAPQIVINLKDANTYREAIEYLKNFIVIFDTWVSDSTEEHPQNRENMLYYNEMIEHIYKLQAFALMTKEYFNNNKYGKNFIENFDFESLIIDEPFREYFLSIQPLEQEREHNREEPKMFTRKEFNNLRKLSRQLTETFKQLEETVSNIEMREFTKNEKGYE